MGLFSWLFGDSEAAHRMAIARARGDALLAVNRMRPPPPAEAVAEPVSTEVAAITSTSSAARTPVQAPSATLTIESWCCTTEVKLSQPIATPMGGRVTCVTFWLDIEYYIADRRITVVGARLASNTSTNVASTRRGEAWWASDIPVAPGSLLELANAELNVSGSRLRRLMYGKWSGMLRGAQQDEGSR